MDEGVTILSTLGQALLIVGGFTLGFVAVTMFFTMLWVRRKVQGKVVAHFIESNRQTTEELLPIDESGIIKSKHGDGDEEYLIVPKKSFWSKWPKGFPVWMQESVPTLLFMRNNAEPFDPEQIETVITAKTLKYITDEKMLKATWQDAADSIGLGPSNFKSPIVILGILLGAGIIGLGVFLFIIFQQVQDMDVFLRSLA
jgi:hypothetical protein